MDTITYSKFWTDKEFDARLYDIALKESPNITNFEACISHYAYRLYPKEKYLERLYDFIVYYADKGIFLDNKIYNTDLCLICKDIINLNKNIDKRKYDYKKIDPVNILDMMYEKGYKPSLTTIYKLYFESKIFNKDINIKERYDLKENNTIDHLELANEYGKILIPTNFSLDIFEEFCGNKMKDSIVKNLLKYLKPNMNCLQNACYENNNDVLMLLLKSNKELKFDMTCLETACLDNFKLTKFILESNKELNFNMTCLSYACISNNCSDIQIILDSNKELKFNIKCLENSIMHNKDISVAKLIFPDIKKEYDDLINIKNELDNKNKPIESELIKKIEKK